MLDAETARKVKWNHAMNPRPVQKIANMQMRMAEYQEEMKSFLASFFVPFALVSACIVLLFVYFLPVLAPLVLPDLGPIKRDPTWWITGAGIWLVLLIPPFMMMKPKRPSDRDILADIALRRQVGMDDSVAD